MSSEGAKFPYVGESGQRFPPNADDGPVATASKATQTEKDNFLDFFSQNKENTAAAPASQKKLLKLCALSDVFITSFCPHETGVKTEKSFTCVHKRSTPTISTPKSVLSELNVDSCSRELLDTPSTSKKARRDLTKPQKLRPTLKQTPIIESDSADESSDASPLVKPNRTKSDTPPSSAPSHQVAKRTKKQIAAKSVEATAPVDTPKRPSLLMARRKFLKPVRLPFHPHKRTPAQLAADKERARTKCPSLFFLPVPVPQSSPKPGSEAQEDPPSVEESVEVVKELPQSSPEKETSQIHLESSKGPVLSAPIAMAEESIPLPAVEEPVNHSLPEKEGKRAEIRSEPCKEPFLNAPPPIEEPLWEDDESAPLSTKEIQSVSSEPLHENRRETTTKVLPSKVQMDDVVIELSDSNSSHAPQKKFPTQAATPTVEAATKAPAVEEPSSSGAPAEVELNEDSCSRDLLDTLSTSKKARRDLKKPQKLRPTLKQTPISVSGSADESSDASPLVKHNRTKSDTPPSSAPSHQVAKRTKKQIAAKSVEATAPVDTPKRPSLLMARRKFLKPVRLPFHPHKRTPAQLAVDKERARTKCPSLFFLPVPVPVSHSSPKPGSEAQEDPPSVEESVEVVKELPQSSPEKETSQTAEETKVPVTTPDDAPSEAATVEPTPAQGVESPAEIKSAPEGDSIRVETQAAPVETDSEQNKRQTLATEKQLQSNSENGNQSLEEKIFKKVKPETETENREKQEAEVAAEGAAKQDAKKATRLGHKDEHSHAREEVLPAAKRVTRKGSSVEKTTEASDSERPRRRGRKSISEKQPILEDKEANMDTVQRRGRKPSKEVDEANPEPETSKSNPEKPKRRGRQPSAEEAKDIEAKNKEEEILNAIEEEEMPSEQSKQKKALLPSTTEARPETAKRGGRLPSAEKNEPQEAKAQEIVLPNKDDHTVDSELRKPPKEVLPETSKRRGRPPSAEKEAAKDDTQNPKALGLLLAIKEDQPAGAGAEPMKPLKRTRKSSERVKTKQASQPTATKEDQTDAQADRPKRRGRKSSVDVELAALDVPEKPRRRGQKADAADKEPALTKRMALAEPVDPHLEKITKEIEQEPEPEPNEEEQKTRRRGRKPTTETVDVPEEHVETTSSRRRGRKATVEEAKVGQAEPKSKRHSAQGAPLEAPVPEIQEASTASVKPARRGRKPSMDVDLAEKKKPTRAVRKPSASIDEGTSQANKTTARRGRKASAKEEGIDSQLTNQDVPTGIDGVYSSPSHIEDERTPRRRSGRNIPRKNYKEVSDDDSSGTRCNRKPVTLPDPTTSQRRERRNLPRKNYTEPPDDDDDDDKPTPSRSRRQRNPTVKTLELIVDTTPRPATSRRRKGKAGAEEPHEEDLPVKKTCTELAEEPPAVATTAVVKGRGTRRKVENVAEAESAEMEEAEPRAAARKNTRGNARKAKVGTDSDSEAQPAAKKARGGARAKTPVRMISDGEQPEPTKEPAVAVAAKKPAPIFEPEAEQPAPSTEPAAPTAPMTRSRAKKVLFEATPAVAESASSNDEAPKRALRPRRK